MLVKKLISFLLMLIYFTVTTGFTVSMHYCMDKLDSAQIGLTENDECGKCGMDISDSNGCCRSETKVFKLQQDQSQAFFTIINFSLSPVIISKTNSFDVEEIETAKEGSKSIHAPPLINNKQDTYIRNCVFRI